MTSSITLGGIRDVDLGFRVLEETKDPLLPSTRDMNVEIAGKHGQYDFGADLTERVFSFLVLLLRMVLITICQVQQVCSNG